MLASLGGASRPLALLAEVEPLGQGVTGTVVGLLVSIAPEDRDRAGERIRVTTSLLQEGAVVDRHTAVVEVEQDGSVLLYRDWAVGEYELHVMVSNLEAEVSGIWVGDVVVPASAQPFVAPDGALPDAVALTLTPAKQGAVSFKVPSDHGGIGAIQLEVEVPEHTSSVEFLQDGQQLIRRNRPPWTVSVSLGEIVRRTTVTAVALDEQGNYIGEDALVLNNPTGELGVEILLAPESTITDGKRTVTVAVSGSGDLQQISLFVDDRQVARWVECPCVTEVSVAELERSAILAAEATARGEARGDAVLSLTGGSGFGSTIRVELVELPVVVLDELDNPVTGLDQAVFSVYEDDQPVVLEGFGTTGDLPLSLALAVDTSGSMMEEFPRVRRAVSTFAASLMRPGDQATLLTFSWDAKVLVPWSDDPGVIASRLDRVIPEGGTSLHDAVVRSLEQFRGRRGRQALVMLTDGEDTTSRTPWDTTRRFVHTMRIPVFPIGLGVRGLDFSARKTLRRLAEETGSEVFFPKHGSDLPQAYARISELLRSQYLLWYRSSSDKADTEFREIRVEIANPDLTVKTIRGYYPGK
jgi:VWFA-related protein